MAAINADQSALMLLADALGAGLEEHEMRMGGWRGARLQPEEWKPQTAAELVKSRRAVWDRLLQLGHANEPVIIASVAKIFAHNTRTLVRYPFMSEVFDELMTLDFSPGQRATIADGLRNALRFDAANMTQEVQSLLEQYSQQLMGQDRSSRLLAVIATPPWDLDDRFYNRDPEAIVAIVDELMTGNNHDVRAELRTAIQSPEAHGQTRYVLGASLGRRDEDNIFESLIQELSIPMDFSAGYLRGMSTRDSEHVEDILDNWLLTEKFDAVLNATSSLEATPRRALRAIATDTAAEMAGQSTNLLQQLAFGSWLAPLPPQEAIQVIAQLADKAERKTDFAAIDAALFAADSYIGHQDSLDADLLALGRRIVILSTQGIEQHGRDLTYLRNHLADRVKFSPPVRLELILRSLEEEHFASPENITSLRAVLLDLSEDAIDQVFQWLIRQPFGIDIYLQDAHLASLLAEVFGDTSVSERMAQLPLSSQKRLLAHLDWTGEMPMPARSLLAVNDDLRAEMTRRFLYPGQVVSGEYSIYLASRRTLLAQLASETIDSKVRDWARALLPDMDNMIEEEKLRESEQD